MELTKDERKCYKANYPTLGMVGKAFEFGTAQSWVMAQLENLAEFSGCRDKLKNQQLEELSELLVSSYGYMKLSELMDFFRRFKLGEYGKFYGAVDPMVITCALQTFARDRQTILSRLEREDRDKRRFDDPVLRDIRRKGRAWEEKRKFWSWNFRKDGMPWEEFKELWWLFNMGYERANHGYL